jgi:hypothetical protein
MNTGTYLQLYGSHGSDARGVLCIGTRVYGYQGEKCKSCGPAIRHRAALRPTRRPSDQPLHRCIRAHKRNSTSKNTRRQRHGLLSGAVLIGRLAPCRTKPPGAASRQACHHVTHACFRRMLSASQKIQDTVVTKANGERKPQPRDCKQRIECESKIPVSPAITDRCRRSLVGAKLVLQRRASY